MKGIKVAFFHLYFLIHVVEKFISDFMEISKRKQLSTFLFLKKYEKASKMKKLARSSSKKMFCKLVNKVEGLDESPEDIKYWRGSVVFQLALLTNDFSGKKELLKECLECIPGHGTAGEMVKSMESEIG